MHELSIVNSILRTLEIEFDVEKRKKMQTIYVKVGLLSNIEPRLLYNAYSASVLMRPEYHHVDLRIEVSPIQIQCEQCNSITEVVDYRFQCDECQLPSKNIISGKELLIHKIEFKNDKI